MFCEAVEAVAEVPGAVDASVAIALDDSDAVLAARDDVAVDMALDVVEEGVLASTKAFFDFIHGGEYRSIELRQGYKLMNGRISIGS